MIEYAYKIRIVFGLLRFHCFYFDAPITVKYCNFSSLHFKTKWGRKFYISFYIQFCSLLVVWLLCYLL